VRGCWIASIKKQDVSKPKCINSVCSPTDLTVFLTSSQLSAAPSPSLQMQGKMMAYDRVVVELNAARLRDASFPVVHAFIQAALSLNPDVRAVHVAQGVQFNTCCVSELIRSYKYSISSQK
jgi:hypothetical protein